MAWELGRDWYSLRAAYLVGKVSVAAENVLLPTEPPLSIGAVFSGLTGAGFGALVNEIDINEEDGAFLVLVLLLTKTTGCWWPSTPQ